MKALIAFNYWQPNTHEYTANSIVDVPGGKLTARAVEEIKDALTEKLNNQTGLRGSVTILNIIKLDQ